MTYSLQKTTEVLTGSLVLGVDLDISRMFVGNLYIELVDGTWTDVTEWASFRSGPLTIRQGRPTPFDEISPASLRCELWNDDGRFMPDNTASPHYPNFIEGKRIMWTVTKNSVTYTRFTGWIQAISPQYPGNSTTGATVTITATDALGLLLQREIRAYPAEVALWRQRTDGAPLNVDCWEFTSRAASGIPYPIRYTPTGVVTESSFATSANYPELRTGTNTDITSAGVLNVSPDSSAGTSNMLFMTAQGTITELYFMVFMPTELISGVNNFQVFLSLGTTSGTTVLSLAAAQDATTNCLRMLDSTRATVGGNMLCAPFGQWKAIQLKPDSSDPTKTNVSHASMDDSTWTTYTLSIDMRTAQRIWFPGRYAQPFWKVSYGSVIAFSGAAPSAALAPWNFWSASSGTTIGGRWASVEDILSDIPSSVTWDSWRNPLVPCRTGGWAGRKGLDILQENIRSARGIVWCRPWDGTITHVGPTPGWVRSFAPAATIDLDLDCARSPTLTRSFDVQPSRVEVSHPGGAELVIDTDMEVSGLSRSISTSSVAAADADVRSLGRGIIADGSSGTRISSISVSLITGATDHTAALLNETDPMGGLYPTSRISLTVPASHFGTTTRDCIVQGWTESYSPNDVTIEMDTFPVETALSWERWQYAAGSPWPTQWTTRFGGGATGATFDTTANGRGRIIVGSGGNRAGSLLDATYTDTEIVGTIYVVTTAEAHVYWRTDATAVNGYLLTFSVANGCRVRSITSGSYATLYSGFASSVTASTYYSFRIRHVGTHLQVRVWPSETSVEPVGTWHLDVTDSTFTSAGHFGVAGYGASTTTYFDALGVLAAS